MRDYGLTAEPVGVDVIEMPILSALQKEGLTVVDGQQVFLEARRIKTADEIALLAQACSMVDAAYEELYAFLRPGVRENECVGLVSKVLYDLGSEYVEGVNAISGERCSPHPHVYSDRIVRPGDPAFFDILHSHLGYRTCYYRCFAVGSASPVMRDAYVRCREYMDATKQSQDLLEVTASMRTALLVYGGINVKMMVDSDLGAQLATMFMVHYDPDGATGPHDHPFEETYFFLEGQAEATFDGEPVVLGVGDIAWAGVGCPHSFRNLGGGPLRWLETQAPQPPRRYSYRFARDWDYLREVLG